MTKKEIALDLIKKGYLIFQVQKDNKQPFGTTAPNGCKDATIDSKIVSTWFKNYPDQNIGIKCSNILVIDVDIKEKSNGFRALKYIESELGELNAPTIETPSGGLHFYFKRPEGVQIIGRTKVPYKGYVTPIDIRIGNQYVLSPGSSVKGKSYNGELPPVDELPEIPRRWLEEFIPKKDSIPKAAELPPIQIPEKAGNLIDRCKKYLDSLPPAISGQNGHSTMLWACRVVLKGFCLSGDIAKSLILSYNSRCQPPFNQREIAHKIEQAQKADFELPDGWLLKSDSDNAPDSQDGGYLPEFLERATSNKQSKIEPKSSEIQTVEEDKEQSSEKIDLYQLYPVPADEFVKVEIKRPDYIIYPFFRENETALIYAQRGVGKTWFALTLAAGISQGRWLFGAPFWYCTKARKVLYLDGEMAAPDLQERLISIRGNNPNLIIENPEFGKRSNSLDLFDDRCQAAVIKLAIDMQIEVIVIDNLATLYHCPKPNDSESWRQYDKFIIECRRLGIALIIIDHCGKNFDNGAAGSYAKQNIVNHCIELEQLEEMEGEGCRFLVNFSKSRSCYGSSIQSLLLACIDGNLRVVKRERKSTKDSADESPASVPESKPEKVQKRKEKGELNCNSKIGRKTTKIQQAIQLLEDGKSRQEIFDMGISYATITRAAKAIENF